MTWMPNGILIQAETVRDSFRKQLRQVSVILHYRIAAVLVVGLVLAFVLDLLYPNAGTEQVVAGNQSGRSYCWMMEQR